MNPSDKSLSPDMSTWEIDPSLGMEIGKTDENQMLRLDELIEQHAYEE